MGGGGWLGRLGIMRRARFLSSFFFLYCILWLVCYCSLWRVLFPVGGNAIPYYNFLRFLWHSYGCFAFPMVSMVFPMVSTATSYGVYAIWFV